MKTALLISTYNWSEALNLSLQSALRQSVLPDEILIADDGSTGETKELIESFQKRASVPIKHFWHEDNGFQKTIILNKAVAGTDADYIIETDGDCILHKHFVKDHLRRAKPNRFLYGDRIYITQDYVEEVLKNNKIKFSSSSEELEKGKKNKCLHFPFLNIFQNQRMRYRHLLGCNMSYWRKDLLEINGRNEDYIGWGVGDDTDVALRLIKKGVSSYKLKYSAIIYHIWHVERSKDRFKFHLEMLEKEKLAEGYFCKNGIDKYL